jgi:hypothetical protein
MKLSGSQFEQLQDALLSAFPSRDSFARMLRYGMNQTLDSITSAALRHATYEVIAWAEAHGQIEALFAAALKANPSNDSLCAIDFIYTKTTPAVASSTPSTPTRSEKLMTNFSDRQIHLSHKKGLMALVRDALGTTGEKAQMIFDALFEKDVSYQELPGLKERALVSAIQGQLGEKHGIKETRIDELLQAIHDVTPDRRYCEKCDRLDLDRKAGKWFVLDRDTCPKDDGLYKHVAFPTPFRAWTDHQMYEPGTRRDEKRLPIDEDELREHIESKGGAVHTWIGSALQETRGALTLIGLADYLLWQSKSFGDPASMAAKVAVIRALTDPTTFAFDETALRVEIHKALKAQGTTMADVQRGDTVTQQPVGPNTEDVPQIQTDSTTMRELRKQLATMYPHVTDAVRIATDAGVSNFDRSGNPESLWFGLLEEAKRLHLAGKIVALAHAEYPKNPYFRALLDK